MSIKLYTDRIPENILQELKNLNIVANKDKVCALYVNTFLGKIRDAAVLTPDKLIHWQTKISNNKVTVSFKKVKDITYEEKGLYGTIVYHLSAGKNFTLKLNRQDSAKFMDLSGKLWRENKDQ
ncbi:MAG: hypothetical protein ACOWWO_10545 [Peptococcaceae bacterium]